MDVPLQHMVLTEISAAIPKFQSLFLWMFLFNFMSCHCVGSNSMFQSLFLWMFLFNASLRSCPSRTILCFNPCFYGCSSSTATAPSYLADCSCFNPCFYGCSSSTHINYAREERKESFNPCFYGCSSSTRLQLLLHKNVFCFNPCFYGCSSSTKKRQPVCPKCNRFQSLFLWMFLFNPRKFLRMCPGIDVSILVFMDVPLQQIYFSRESTQKKGFNPCFYGCSSSTNLFLQGKYPKERFQSLFLWMFLFNKLHIL